MSFDPYAVLGVARDASADEIKAAYRRKAKEFHPDLHPGDATKADKFKQASAAFDILGDTDKRGRYDRGEIDADGNELYRDPFGGAGRRGPRTGGAQGDAFEDILDGIFGRGRTRRGQGPMRRRGQDVRYRVEIDFADAVAGARRRLDMADGRALDVQIPAGLESGQTLRLKGQGEASPQGGPPGDVLLEVTVKPDPVFTRDGNDLRMALGIPLETAVLGGKVEVNTPSGKVTLKVPEGSNTGKVLRLKGRGVQVSPNPGHLYARLEIVLDDPKDSALKGFLKGR